MNNHSLYNSSIRQSEDSKHSSNKKSFTPKRQLEILLTEENKVKYSKVPPQLVPPVKRQDRTFPGLKRCAYDWLRLNGHPVEIICKTANKRGYPDILTTINGRQFYILTVPGAMLQSSAQWRYQRAAESRGHGYIIAKSFADFHSVYCCITATKAATVDEHL